MKKDIIGRDITDNSLVIVMGDRLGWEYYRDHFKVPKIMKKYN